MLKVDTLTHCFLCCVYSLTVVSVCGQRQGAEKRDQVDFYLTRGRGNISPTDDYIIEHVMLANSFNRAKRTELGVDTE
jgi:hypothetical protein